MVNQIKTAIYFKICPKNYSKIQFNKLNNRFRQEIIQHNKTVHYFLKLISNLYPGVS